MTELIRIRFATAADAALLTELGRRTFFDSFAADNNEADMEAYLRGAFSPAKQAAELEEPGSVFLVAEVEGKPAGYARIRRQPAPDCVRGGRPMEIARFYACREWIGRGVGAALMQACLEEAAHRGCDTVWLSSWERNPRALAFYRKWGFAEAGEQVFLLGSDAQKDLILQMQLR